MPRHFKILVLDPRIKSEDDEGEIEPAKDNGGIWLVMMKVCDKNPSRSRCGITRSYCNDDVSLV